ncbi:hypothetical protein SBA1_1040046 [Candidatus Sulfotelmatobacter kueseliae]|uniref:Uncharacterized protein n=1 Tax=Candidatus Sulfotelmatobacter kueseliae TaxID=2042962 RepID=A0A2U3JY53_9BACT|nr:hypothetical protein SBA1_1040046 [Candidatus Sulfotelmatobacter kueseliae]
MRFDPRDDIATRRKLGGVIFRWFTGAETGVQTVLCYTHYDAFSRFARHAVVSSSTRIISAFPALRLFCVKSNN